MTAPKLNERASIVDSTKIVERARDIDSAHTERASQVRKTAPLFDSEP